MFKNKNKFQALRVHYNSSVHFELVETSYRKRTAGQGKSKKPLDLLQD